MISLNQYILNNCNSLIIDENLVILPVLKKLGILLLSSVIPFLISLGVKITSLKLDDWVNNLKIKYPQYKDAIDILIEVLKEHLGGMKKCNSFVSDTEKQKPSKLLTIDDIKKEVLPLISNSDDKKKVEDFLDLMESREFKEEIDECVFEQISNL